MNSNYHSEKGFITLISVLIVSAVGVAIATSLLALGLSDAQSSLTVYESGRARYAADACSEHALDKLREDANYPGNETYNIPAGGLDTCNVVQIVLDSGIYTIFIEAHAGEAVRKVIITAVRLDGPPVSMQVQSWQEVADF